MADWPPPVEREFLDLVAAASRDILDADIVQRYRKALSQKRRRKSSAD